MIDAPDTFPIGTTVLSVEATDQSGNSATAQTSIIVVRSVQQPFFVSTGADFEVNAFDVLTFDIAVEKFQIMGRIIFFKIAPKNT